MKINLLAHAEVQRPLSPEQEAHSIMVAHFIENSLYYGLFYHRWINPTVGPMSLWRSSDAILVRCSSCCLTSSPQSCPSAIAGPARQQVHPSLHAL